MGMASMRVSEWRKLPVSLAELCIETTLRCGQSFRWKKLRDNEWTCALHGRILSLKQDSTHLHYKTTWPPVLSHTMTPPLSGHASPDLPIEDELLQLQGVGPKVADCVCLMGLGWGEAVPVDTHVWQIAQRDYKFGRGKHKSLTKATYDAVGDHFRQLWGKEAGWAHSVLFAADLKTFSERLNTKIEVDVDEVRIKKEDGSILESKVVVKRELVMEGQDEVLDEKKDIKVETSRSKRAKRRKL